MTKFDVIYEQAADGSWSARAAALPVFSAGATRHDAEREIRQGIALYLDELAESGEEPPPATNVIGTVEV